MILYLFFILVKLSKYFILLVFIELIYDMYDVDEYRLILGILIYIM